MASRYPLVIDTGDNNKIKELPNGDNLNLTGNNIVNVVNVTGTGALSVNSVEVTSNTFTVNGNSLNTVAFTGNYADLTGTPTIFNGNYDNLTNKPTLKTTIESLDNVSTTAPTNNQVLQYDSSSGTYKPSSIASVSASSIDDLLDVNVSNIASASGQILKWDGSAWIRGNASSGQDADTLDSYEGTYYLNYNNFTNKPNVLASVTADDTDTFTATSNTDNFKIYGGTGITTSILNDVVTITNSAPDQTVAFTNGTNITVTGTYPNFTISSNALAGISVGTPATPNSAGSIGYSNGVITFTPPDLSSYLTTISGSNLADLANVDATAPTDGQVLKWSGTAWAPAADGGGSGSGGGTLVEDVVDYTASGTVETRNIADGDYLTDRSNNIISAQITIPSGSTKNIVEFRGQFGSSTDSSFAKFTFERQINSGSFVAVKTQIIDNGVGSGTDSILLDTHGANAGDTVTYRIKNASGDTRTLWYYSNTHSAYRADSVFSVRAVGATTGGGGGGGGNETFVDFAASGTDLSRTITPGSYLKDRSGNDLEVQITISSGGTKNLVRFHGTIYTTLNTPTSLTFERSVNSGAYTTVKTMPGEGTSGSDSVIIDTHGASAGDTVKYKIKNSMTGSTNSTLYYASSAAGNYPAIVYESVFSVREIGVSASSGGGSGDIEAVAAGTGLTGGGTTGSVTLNVDVGTTANKIVQIDSTGKLPAIDGSQLTNISGGGGQNLFATVAVSGQNNVVADTTTDTLTLVAGSNITITTDQSTDSITFASSGSTDLNSLSAGNINTQNDSIGFIDADDSNNSKKESIVDFLTAIAGSGISVSSGQLTASGGGGSQNVFSTIAVSGQSDVVADSATDTLTLVAGSNITITTNASGDSVTIASSGSGGSQNLFSTFAVSGQNSVVADSTTDTLTLVAGGNMTITTDQSNDSITFASSQNLFETIAVSGQNSIVADGSSDTLTFAAGGGLTITTNDTTDTVTFATYLDGLTGGTIDKTDSIAFIDATDQSTKKATINSLLTQIAGANITVSGNQLTTTTGIADVVDDTSPQLGGDLDVNGRQLKYTFNITASGSNHYVFNDTNNLFFSSSGENDPTLYLQRGNSYVFNNTTGAHPLAFKTPDGTAYTTGVTTYNTVGKTFNIPMNAPPLLYYYCTSHAAMQGKIYIDGDDLNSVAEAAIDTANDKIAFIDDSDPDKVTKKEAIPDFLEAIKGTGLGRSGGQLTATNTFVGLTDTPSAFAGSAADANKFVRVNTGGSALIFDTVNTGDITEGSNLYYTDARAQAISINALSEDAAPTLGANLTAGSYDISMASGNLVLGSGNITSVTNQDIDIDPHGTGKVTVGSNLNITGTLQGPSSFTIDPAAYGDNTGTVIIAGNLQVDGTTTTINSTTLDVDDLNITVAKGAANAAAANGAGLTVDGAAATFTYASSGDKWVANKQIFAKNASGVEVDLSAGATTGKAIAMAMVFG